MKLKLRYLSFFLISLCLGGTLSAQSYYVSGVSSVEAGSVYEYYLEGSPAVPSDTYVTWTAVNGEIEGESSGSGLLMVYVYWPAGITTGSINATAPSFPGGLSVTLNVSESAGLTTGAAAVPATWSNSQPAPGGTQSESADAKLEPVNGKSVR